MATEATEKATPLHLDLQHAHRQTQRAEVARGEAVRELELRILDEARIVCRLMAAGELLERYRDEEGSTEEFIGGKAVSAQSIELLEGFGLLVEEGKSPDGAALMKMTKALDRCLEELSEDDGDL